MSAGVHSRLALTVSTAGNSSLSTSEFSQCFTVAGAPPTLTINDVSATEGNAGTKNFVFTVTISSAANATVNFATADGSATVAGSDYIATSGPLTFTSGGPVTQTITVQVIGDTVVEPDEASRIVVVHRIQCARCVDSAIDCLLSFPRSHKAKRRTNVPRKPIHESFSL